MTAVNTTMRLQFHQNFTLNDAMPWVAYFHHLGITRSYASPLLKARAGYTHGYDVIDPSGINPKRVGESALESKLTKKLQQHLRKLAHNKQPAAHIVNTPNGDPINELSHVDGDPQHVSAPPAQYHPHNMTRVQCCPKSLIATHDHPCGKNTGHAMQDSLMSGIYSRRFRSTG